MIYEFIDIPEHEIISNKIYNYIVDKTDILSGTAIWNWVNTLEILELIPELKLSLENLNLEAQQISIIKANPRANLRIHIDYDREPRMLWPIRNCQGSYTKFFNVEKDNIQKQIGIKGDIYYLIMNPESAKQIDQLELTQPVIFDPSIPHGVWTNTKFDEPRISMTIKFKTLVELL